MRKKGKKSDIVNFTGKIINLVSFAVQNLLPLRKKQLFILKNDGLGDLIIFLPYVDLIRRHYNALGYEVSLMVRTPWKELAERAGCADKVIVQPVYRSALQWLCFRLLFWIRCAFDVIIEGTCEAHDITDSCHCRKRVNIFLKDEWRHRAEKNVISCNVSGLTIHERYAKIAELCGINEKLRCFDFNLLCAPVEAADDGPYILICPDSNDPRKCWEAEKFAEVIRRIRSRSSKRIILTGIDIRKNGSIAEMCKNCENILDLSGKTDLFQLFTLVKKCDMLLSSDTGTAHAGAALKKLTFVIGGRGEYGTFFPYPAGIEGKWVFSVFSAKPCHKCFWRDEECNRLPVYRCLSEINVDRVWELLLEHGTGVLTDISFPEGSSEN